MKINLTILLLVISFLHQTSLSAQWTMKPNTTKGLGRIILDNQPGSVWTIYVYNQADNKYVTSFSHTNNKGIITVPPGTYKITLNNAVVENVPVKKGQDTELKTGLMEINHNELWYLYDESGETYNSSGLKPQKLLMPVGNYQLKVGEVAHTMIVKERDLKKIETSAINPWDFPQWTILPTDNTTTGLGRVNIFLPAGDTTIQVLGQSFTIPIIVKAIISIRGELVTLPKEFEPRTTYANVNGFRVNNLPIRAKNETRIKVGFLIIPTKKDEIEESAAEEFYETVTNMNEPDGVTWEWELKKVNDPSNTTMRTGKKGVIFVLPVGTYNLKYKNPKYGNAIYYTAVITDGEWVRKGVRNN